MKRVKIGQIYTFHLEPKVNMLNYILLGCMEVIAKNEATYFLTKSYQLNNVGSHSSCNYVNHIRLLLCFAHNE